MVMGIAAIAAYALGPVLGGFIFSRALPLGGANALYSVVIGVVGVVLLALVLDLLLIGLGRLTTREVSVSSTDPATTTAPEGDVTGRSILLDEVT